MIVRRLGEELVDIRPGQSGRQKKQEVTLTRPPSHKFVMLNIPKWITDELGWIGRDFYVTIRANRDVLVLAPATKIDVAAKRGFKLTYSQSSSKRSTRLISLANLTDALGLEPMDHFTCKVELDKSTLTVAFPESLKEQMP